MFDAGLECGVVVGAADGVVAVPVTLCVIIVSVLVSVCVGGGWNKQV